MKFMNKILIKSFFLLIKDVYTFKQSLIKFTKLLLLLVCAKHFLNPQKINKFL